MQDSNFCLKIALGETLQEPSTINQIGFWSTFYAETRAYPPTLYFPVLNCPISKCKNIMNNFINVRVDSKLAQFKLIFYDSRSKHWIYELPLNNPIHKHHLSAPHVSNQDKDLKVVDEVYLKKFSLM